MTWFKEAEAFVRQPTVVDDWHKSYLVASSLMDYPSLVDIDLQTLKGTEIRSRIPGGRISMALSSTAIMVGNQLAFSETSPNFRIVVLAHELGHIDQASSPISLITFFGIVSPAIREWNERMINRQVFNQIGKIATPEERKKVFVSCVKELLVLRGREADEINTVDYMATYLPFMLTE